MTHPKFSKRRLILFDIDGTLVVNSKRSTNSWIKRLQAVFTEVYGVKKELDFTTHNVNGLVDRQTFWTIAQMCELDRSVFLQKLDQAFEVFHRELKASIEAKAISYIAIDDAIELVGKLKKSPRPVALGLITGNIERNAWLKLKNAGVSELFTFGAFSDTVESRPELARHALEKSQKYFKEAFRPSETIIIGDTIHDVTAGKSIGALTIAVSSGITDKLPALQAQKPTVAVESLLDKDVISLLFS